MRKRTEGDRCARSGEGGGEGEDAARESSANDGGRGGEGIGRRRETHATKVTQSSPASASASAVMTRVRRSGGVARTSVRCDAEVQFFLGGADLGAPRGGLHSAMGDAGSEDELPDFTPNIYKVVRELKREDHRAYNCLASIVQDAAFVRAVAAAYPAFARFANLRCGVWYAGAGRGASTASRERVDPLPPPDLDDQRVATDGTCYFKSTDGHCNNWSFSAVRLNLHVAEAAARRRGCLVVDATRSATKRFPDSLSKTVPIWADVINRAVADHRERAALKRREEGEESSPPRDDAPLDRDDAAEPTPPAATKDPWRDGPHLPPWISDNERHQIQRRVPGFCAALRAVEPKLDALAATLAAPLRCVWVSSETYERGLPNFSSDFRAFTPLVLVTASAPLWRHGERRSTAEGQSFAYIPGAGDDEESWAGGLAADVFWSRRRALVGEGGEVCEARLRSEGWGETRNDRKRERRRRASSSRRRRGAGGEEGDGGAGGEEDEDGGAFFSFADEGLPTASRDSDDSAAALGRLRVGPPAPDADADADADPSRLAAVGTLGGPAARRAALEKMSARPVGSGDEDSPLRGIALGSASALADPATVARFDAALYVGDAAPSVVFGATPPSRAEAEASSRRNDSSEPSSSSSPPPPPSPSRAFGSLRFFRHVRMRKAKVARLDVAAGLPAALAVREEARRGGGAPTLVACEDGTDHCVGVAVARLCERFATDVVATKADVRKALAEVAARHPEAAPTRGTLKQVFHHLTRGREGEEG